MYHYHLCISTTSSKVELEQALCFSTFEHIVILMYYVYSNKSIVIVLPSHDVIALVHRHGFTGGHQSWSFIHNVSRWGRSQVETIILLLRAGGTGVNTNECLQGKHYVRATFKFYAGVILGNVVSHGGAHTQNDPFYCNAFTSAGLKVGYVEIWFQSNFITRNTYLYWSSFPSYMVLGVLLLISRQWYRWLLGTAKVIQNVKDCTFKLDHMLIL